MTAQEERILKPEQYIEVFAKLDIGVEEDQWQMELPALQAQDTQTAAAVRGDIGEAVEALQNLKKGILEVKELSDVTLKDDTMIAMLDIALERLGAPTT